MYMYINTYKGMFVVWQLPYFTYSLLSSFFRQEHQRIAERKPQKAHLRK